MYHFYTTGEEKFIKENWGVLDTDVIASEIGVTRDALMKHAQRMGLYLKGGRSGAAWSDMEDKALKLMVHFGVSDDDISDALKRGKRAITIRKSYLRSEHGEL